MGADNSGVLPAPPRRDPDAVVLPHSLEAERSCLGAMLVDTGAADYVAGALRAEHFFRRAHQDLYVVMCGVLESKRALDLLTLRDALARAGKLDAVGGAAYVASLADGLPRSTNVAHYAEILIDLAGKRAIVGHAHRTIDLVVAGEHTARQILLDADRRFLDLHGGHVASRLQTIPETASDLYRDLEWRIANQGELTGVDTGFPSINALTGGYQAGDLVVVAARPSVGKTTLVLNQVVHAVTASRRRDGTTRRAAVFSLEMRRRQLEYRILSQLSRVPLSRLLDGALGSVDYAAISRAMETMSTLSLAIDDRAGQSALEIRTACRRLKTEAAGLDLVVIDYVQLMPGTIDRKGANRNEEITDISRRLKDLADEVQAPVVLLSQLRRIEGRPRLDDLRESGSLEQVADVVMLLHRKDHKASGTTECAVAKQRNGPTGTVLLTIDRDTTTFTDGGEPEPEPTPTEKAETRKRTRARTFAERYR